MRNPCRSERDAFRIAVGCALVAASTLLLGLLVAPVYGYAVFGAVATAALAFVLVGKEPAGPARLREAAESAPPERAKTRHRILVVANESLAGAELRREIMRRVELWPELFVVAPALTSRSHLWASDVDHELEEAQRRLRATLDWAEVQGLEARGEVSDPDPLTAIEDALRRFRADEVIIAIHPPERSNWLEPGVVDRVREELEIPVRQVVVDLEHDRVEIEPDALSAAV